jgi:hypothetical protein
MIAVAKNILYSFSPQESMLKRSPEASWDIVGKMNTRYS